MLAQVNQLKADAKLALIHELISDLDVEQIQSLLEFAQREIAERQRPVSPPLSTPDRKTRLLLKKDYSYQNRGLSEPNQYYVYLRRRKPKLDRYIGTLFYIPQGCTLSYFPDAEGRILFNPPHNIFQLKDSKNPSVKRLVRLIGLEPPAPDYTFTKQQNDTPEIYLRLEYLDPITYQPISEKVYPFPFCMYEGGELDRYRWDVTAFIASVDTSPTENAAKTTAPSSSSELSPVASSHQFANSSSETRTIDSTNSTSNSTKQSTKSSENKASQSQLLDTRSPLSNDEAHSSLNGSEQSPSQFSRRVIELPSTKSTTFYLVNRCDSSLVLERMRLWVAWSEKAMPQSRWEIVQSDDIYTLMNASFKRTILSFSIDGASVTIENSLPVLMQWFHDLALAVSQSQSQRCYSAAQLKLAHNLFVEMNLPQDNLLVVLKTLFGTEFSTTSLYC
jgi:hypothetical protein